MKKTVEQTRRAEMDGRPTSMPIDVDLIIQAAQSNEIRQAVLNALRVLDPDSYLLETIERTEQARKQRDDYWDMCGALAAFTKLAQPANYLEIGVRRGRSAAIVGAMRPEVEMYLFDMWYPDYAGVANPGPEFVREELRRVGHRGRIHFGTGRSQETVPSFLNTLQAPPYFELATVDGDHRVEGAKTDLLNVIPRIGEGGMLVFDDIAHPGFPNLYAMWRGITNIFPELKVRENRRDATGTAIAFWDRSIPLKT